MPKYGLQKGDKVVARSSSIGNTDSGKYQKTGGHERYYKPLTVTKTWEHGVRTKEMGYVHNNNILGKSENE